MDTNVAPMRKRGCAVDVVAGTTRLTMTSAENGEPASVSRTSSGKVRNAGPDTHELILVRSDGKQLPLRADDLTIDEDALKPRTVSLLDDDRPGGVRYWKLHLAPGRYVLICNMSGHYLGGMHAQVVVR